MKESLTGRRITERRRLQTDVPSAGADVLLSSGFIAGNSSTSCVRTITNARRFICPHLVLASLIMLQCKVIKVNTSGVTSNFPHFLQVKQINWVVLLCYKSCQGPIVTLLPLPPHVINEQLLTGLAGVVPEPVAVV